MACKNAVIPSPGSQNLNSVRPDIMVHSYNFSYLGDRRIKAQGLHRQKSTRPYLKNRLKAKGLGTWLE
jgi:hypothetical protein